VVFTNTQVLHFSVYYENAPLETIAKYDNYYLLTPTLTEDSIFILSQELILWWAINSCSLISCQNTSLIYLNWN